MTLVDLTFTPATRLSLGRLSELWRDVYAGYPVDLSFSESRLGRHITSAHIILQHSVVAWFEGEPAGFSLAATRGGRAWIGGFGTAPAARGRGIGARLIREQCDRLARCGYGDIALEVLEGSPARRLYESAGFQVERRLVSFDCLTLSGRHARLASPPAPTLATLAEFSKDTPRTWQRDIAALARSLDEDVETAAWPDAGTPRAYAILRRSFSCVEILDIAAIDDHAADVLIAALTARARGRRLKLVDEPAGSRIAGTFRRFGAQPRLVRLEMRRRHAGSQVTGRAA
ncbi:GNAT family N-acetyltransferase [Roseibacterium beibuensis]|uniref:GNAT family N-acetyltransferase n=1 Tax=[Roseibacterium] beibuensis TaxID=1193142 RepID=UPI00217D5AF8|nr:GNAT family N-acetyltransferase [Roseibacterium beibuensis]MCS6627627.1 GNAT family N-acetyltransferase [Roseibacterium beibuensis]